MGEPGWAEYRIGWSQGASQSVVLNNDTVLACTELKREEGSIVGTVKNKRKCLQAGKIWHV